MEYGAAPGLRRPAQARSCVQGLLHTYSVLRCWEGKRVPSGQLGGARIVFYARPVLYSVGQPAAAIAGLGPYFCNCTESAVLTWKMPQCSWMRFPGRRRQ